MPARLPCRTAMIPAAVVAALFIGGCGDAGVSDRPNVVPVSGTVTYNGQPVDGATVTFISKGSARASLGVTDANGVFRLTTYGEQNDGAPPGEYVVTIAKLEGGSAATLSGVPEDTTQLGYEVNSETDKQEEAKSLLPEKYNGADSGLTATVGADGTNGLKFELTD